MIGSSSLGAALLAQLAEGRAGGDLEGQHAGVDVVVVAVGQRRLEVDHREAGQQAVFLGRRQALFDAGDEFLRHVAADHLVLEHVARARLARLEGDLDARELARAAGLLLVGVVDVGPCGPSVSR